MTDEELHTKFEAAIRKPPKWMELADYIQTGEFKAILDRAGKLDRHKNLKRWRLGAADVLRDMANLRSRVRVRSDEVAA